MIKMLHSQIDHLNVASDTLSIGVEIDGLSNADTEKVKKILQLSANRKRKYHYCDGQSTDNAAQILITINSDLVTEDDVVAVTFGRYIATNPYHIQPPLMSIRVLRVLDSIQIKDCEVKPSDQGLKKTGNIKSKTVEVKQKNESTILKIPKPAGEQFRPEKQGQKNVETQDFKTKPVHRGFKKTESTEPKIVEVKQTNEFITSKVSEQAEDQSCLEEQSQNYRILIVDDSVLIHKALDIELEKAPFGSTKDYAESGEACLEKIAKNVYDLVFLDVMMPGIDGFETCTEIRKNPIFKKTPIIMLSSKTSPLDEVKGVMAGCTTYLTKPIKHDEFQKLLGRMNKWLENYKPN